jgi:hypothetical protein
MRSVNQTRPHCVNQMRKTHSKPLAAWHGRGTAWARHAICESAFRVTKDLQAVSLTYTLQKLVFRVKWIKETVEGQMKPAGQ